MIQSACFAVCWGAQLTEVDSCALCLQMTTLSQPCDWWEVNPEEQAPGVADLETIRGALLHPDSAAECAHS